MEKQLILIDISNFVCQIYFGKVKKISSADEVIKKTISVIEKQIRKFEKKGLVYLVFDAPDGKDRRLKIYPEYKAGRKEKPKEVEEILKMLAKLKHRKIMKRGFEADDAIAKISNNCKNREIMIVSGDRDLDALLKDNVKILRRWKIVTDKDIMKKLGINKNLKDFIQVRKALIGDLSDNIKGVSNIGKSKSFKMLKKIKGDDLYNGILNMLNEEQKKEFKLAYELIKFQEQEME